MNKILNTEYSLNIHIPNTNSPYCPVTNVIIMR